MKRALSILIFAFFVAFLATNAQTGASKRKPKQSTASKQKSKGGGSSSAPTCYSDGVLTVKGVTYSMVSVQGGTFTMGATSEQGSDAEGDEKPSHQVTLSSYYIGKTEVTQALWEAVMGKSVSQIASEYGRKINGVGANYPMYYISWDDCQEFIRKLNALTGQNFRLPTEAEWEYAARGGNKSRGYKYSGSNNIGNVAWYYGNSGDKTHPVGTKAPNELGIYDMSGNVYEWCSDWYDKNTIAAPRRQILKVPKVGRTA